MIDINKHPIWKGNSMWGGISPLKKRGHMVRFFLARKYARIFPRNMFIGVTGSVGKTTTVEAVKQVLSEKFVTISTSANLDTILNIPITILKIRPKIKRVVLEFGVEYPGEMEFYLTFVKPATAIVSRIFYQHSEFLGDLSQIAEEKGKLVEQLPAEGTAILNYDDPIVRKLSERTKAKVMFFGIDNKNCHVWAGNIKIENYQTHFELNYGVERVEVRSKLLGSHLMYPLLSAACVGINEGMNLLMVKRGLEKVEPSPHRLQAIPGFNGSVILDDTHNAAPIAVEEALETLNLVPARRRILVFSEMKELGIFSEKLHRQLAQKIFKDKIDLVFLGGGDARYLSDELEKLGFIGERMFSNMQNPQIVNHLLKILSKGDVVLVKGARTTRLDEVVKRISKSK